MDAAPRTVERAFRARARASHPDRFPPGSEAWGDAGAVMMRLVDARRALLAPVGTPPQEWEGRADGWAWADEAGRPVEQPWSMTDRQVDRRRRSWGLAWGSTLIAAAVLSYVAGAAHPRNDALPIWSPALALIGLVALVIGIRAARRLR